jgi:hypothetical protein
MISFTVSDSRLPQPGGLGWRSYTPRDWFPFRRLLRPAGVRWTYSTPPPHRTVCVCTTESESESYVTTDGKSASLSWNTAPIWGLQTVAGLLMWGALSLWREDGSVVYNCCWPSPAQSFSGPSPRGTHDHIYCLRFETSLFVASYDSQGYGGGIRPRLHMRCRTARCRGVFTVPLDRKCCGVGQSHCFAGVCTPQYICFSKHIPYTGKWQK